MLVLQVIYGRVTNLSELVTNKITKQSVKVGEEKVEADLVISCVGLPPNVPSIIKLVPGDNIDEQNRIKVSQDILSCISRWSSYML